MLEGFAGGTVLGERFGEGPVALLALHGWQRTHRDFAATLAAPIGFGAVALDLAGFGATPPPSEPWGSVEYAASLIPVLDELGGPVILVGHSFGGRVAIQLAVMAPNRIAGLCLTGVPQLAPGVSTGRQSRAFQRLKFARRLGLINEKRLERARMDYGSRDYREAEGVLRGVLVRVLADRYAELLPQIQCPVELVWGALDTAAPLEGARFAEQALGSATLTVLDGVGHLVPTEAPMPLRAAIERLRR